MYDRGMAIVDQFHTTSVEDSLKIDAGVDLKDMGLSPDVVKSIEGVTEEERAIKLTEIKSDISKRARRRSAALQAALRQVLSALELNSAILERISDAAKTKLRLWLSCYCTLDESFHPNVDALR